MIKIYCTEQVRKKIAPDQIASTIDEIFAEKAYNLLTNGECIISSGNVIDVLMYYYNNTTKAFVSMAGEIKFKNNQIILIPLWEALFKMTYNFELRQSSFKDNYKLN